MAGLGSMGQVSVGLLPAGRLGNCNGPDRGHLAVNAQPVEAANDNALAPWDSHSTRPGSRCLVGVPPDRKSPDGLPGDSLEKGLPGGGGGGLANHFQVAHPFPVKLEFSFLN